VFFFVLICVLIPIGVNGATLYLSPSTAKYGVGETFIVEVRIDLEPGENINVVEVKLQYPADILEVKDISFGNSILTVIPEKPKISVVSCEIYNSCGFISFGGGIIGGYTGRIPGDPGLSNLLAKIIFSIIPRQMSRNFAEIIFQESSRVLLNDGFGTPAKLTAKNSTIEIRPPYFEEKKKDGWKKEIENDKIPPEPFKPEIIEIDGKYYLIFSTTDKKTGVDHYEISETKNKNKENWQKEESPYLLTDQSLKSFIKVKAVDKARNERIETIYPSQITLKIRMWQIILVSVLFFAILTLLYLWLRKFIKSQKP